MSARHLSDPSRLGVRDWVPLVAGPLIGGLAAAAVGGTEPGWPWLALACAVIGASASGVSLLGHRLDVSAPAMGFAAGAVAGLEGLFFTYLALRGDSEVLDSLIGTTVMAVGLGLVCAVATALLLLNDDDEGSDD